MINFFDNDIEQIVYNFDNMLTAIMISPAHRMNITISLKSYFSFMRAKYASSADSNELNYIVLKLEGK